MAMRVLVVVVFMVMREVNVKFYAGDGRFLLARDMQVIAVELEFHQLAFEPLRVHAEVQQRGDKHVTGDAADEVEIEGFHLVKETFNIQRPTSN